MLINSGVTAKLPAVIALSTTLVLGCASPPDRPEIGTPPAEPVSAHTDAPAWTLRPRARVDADSANFIGIAVSAVGPGGVLALMQRGDARVVLLDQDGSMIGAVGAVGDGPGEFRFMGHLGWKAETLWVSDITHRRIAYFDRALQLIRDEGWAATASNDAEDPDVLSPERSSMSFPWGITGEGHLLFYVADPLILSRLASGASTVFLLSGRGGGGIPMLVGMMPKADEVSRYTFESKGGPPGVFPVPFRFRPLFGIAPDASALVVLTSTTNSDDSITAVQADLTRVDGREPAIVRLEVTRALLPQLVRDSLENAVERHDFLRQFAVDRGRDVKALQALIPRRYPPVQSILIDSSGRLWIGLPSGEWGQRWIIFDDAGASLGQLVAPRRVTIVGALDEVVWGLEEGADGLQSPIRYALDTSGPTDNGHNVVP